MKKSLILVIIVIVVSLFAAQWMQMSGVEEYSSEVFSERVNLALRQTGHQLLLLNGDSTSTVPPVEVIDDNRYKLQIEEQINYDTLGFLLKDAFAAFNISGHYHTVVQDCFTEEILLGFNDNAVASGEIACKGREQVSSCYIIKVVFENKGAAKTSFLFAQIAFALLLLLLVIRLFFFRKEEAELFQGIESLEKSNDLVDESSLTIGNSELDIENQTYTFHGVTKDLTFREAKLLGYFSKNPNSVLERDKILDEVWGDEGVIVGRSLDVFVSRIRKLIANDDSINIKTVHGVGYKFEVNQKI